MGFNIEVKSIIAIVTQIDLFTSENKLEYICELLGIATKKEPSKQKQRGLRHLLR